MFRLAPAAAVIAATLGAVSAASAEPISLRSEYATSLYGIVVARSTFESRIDENGFDITGVLNSSGLARIFDDTQATASARGRFEDGGPSPDSYSVDYTSGKKRKSTAIAFAGGDVVKAENSPPVKTNREDWIPVEKKDLSDVVDPISAALVRSETPSGVCGRTIRVFDGAMRADLVLEQAGFGEASVPGYSGEMVRCKARFVPVAGYRQGNKSIAFLRKSSDISIAFAPIGSSGVYAPVEATVGTQVGTIKLKAVRFEALK